MLFESSNLPAWPGAAAAYSRAYRNLAGLCASEATTRKVGRYVPSQDVRDYIEALESGDEERVKYFNLLHLSRGE